MCQILKVQKQKKVIGNKKDKLTFITCLKARENEDESEDEDISEISTKNKNPIKY